MGNAVTYAGQGLTNAGTAAQNGLTNANNAAAGGVAGANNAVANGLTGASNATNQGVNAIGGYNAAATAPWQTVFNSASGGANAYGDATGANGAAGQARARSNFQTDPGYNFQMDQGLQALDRTAAARGALTGNGGTNADTLRYSQGLADQSYGNYVNRLSPYLGQQSGAAGGIAGANTTAGGQIGQLYGNLAGANATGGNALAGISGTAGNNLATINAGMGGNIAGLNATSGDRLAALSGSGGNTLAGINGNLFGNLAGIANTNNTNQANLANSMYTGIGNSNAAATMNNYNVGANQLGALLGLGGLVSGGIGGAGGIGKVASGLGNSLGSLFNNNNAPQGFIG